MRGNPYRLSLASVKHSPHLLSSTVLWEYLDFKSLLKEPKSLCGGLVSLVSYQGCFDSLSEVTAHGYEDCLLNKSENPEPQWRLNFYTVFYHAKWQPDIVKESWADMLLGCGWLCSKLELMPAQPSPLQAEHSLSTVFNNKWVQMTLPDFGGWIIKGSMTSACCFLFQTEHEGPEPRGFYICLQRQAMISVIYSNFCGEKGRVLMKGINAEHFFY